MRLRLASTAVIAVLSIVSLACGPPRQSPAAARPPTTRAPAAPVPVDLGRSLRVLLVGDSLMFDAAPAIQAALESTSSVEVQAKPWLGSGLTKTDLFDWRAQWPLWVRDFDPDLVVVLTGAWDVAGGGRLGPDAAAPTVPAGWTARYRALVTEALATLQAGGARVAWIGMPWTRSLATPAQISALDEAVAEAVSARAGEGAAWYIDGRAVLAGRDGGYADRLPGRDGQWHPVRKADGLHFCPAGAARLAEAVLAGVTRRWRLTAPSDWESGAWRADGRYAPDKGCAPAAPQV